VGAAAGYLLYVGRLRIRKAVEVLLEALALLGDGRPEVLVVGDGEHAGRLARRVAELGLAVEFLGRRDPGQVRSLMERAGGLVVPSIYEGMPLVVLEAMEAGLPVIASRVSGIPEVVIDGETGWLVPPEDPPALAAALDEWRRDPGEARRRGEAGRRRLETLYSTAGTAARWLDLVAPGPLEGGPSDGAQSDR
jgi:glycosyltransferase involved in cell wall biosynthesis